MPKPAIQPVNQFRVDLPNHDISGAPGPSDGLRGLAEILDASSELGVVLGQATLGMAGALG